MQIVEGVDGDHEVEGVVAERKLGGARETEVPADLLLELGGPAQILSKCDVAHRRRDSEKH